MEGDNLAIRNQESAPLAMLHGRVMLNSRVEAGGEGYRDSGAEFAEWREGYVGSFRRVSGRNSRRARSRSVSNKRRLPCVTAITQSTHGVQLVFGPDGCG